ncbi:MAG: MFS transporter, partial [Candidatus Zixiibacteriota bacterium]
TVNGLLVALLQIPVTRALAGYSLTAQLALGGVLYALGYGMVGFLTGFWYFALAIGIVTLGEIIMSPPSLTLTSRLAPPGRMGRYMGIQGFFMSAGWSFGPLYGNLILDAAGSALAPAWLAISSLAVVSAIGYVIFGCRLPRQFNEPKLIT